MKNKKDNEITFYKGGFPDHLASNEEKDTLDYGLKMAKTIEYEWWHRPDKAVCSYYDRRDRYHTLRLYARGEQSTDLYKQLLIGDSDTAYTNYDWRPIQIIPKFVSLMVNQMSERLFEVRAEATDKFSTDLRDSFKEQLENFLLSRPIMEEAKNQLGVDIMPDDMEAYPETQEEIDLFMKLKYKPAVEIATEEALQYTLDINDYEQTQNMVIEDLTVLGVGAVKVRLDNDKGILVDWVDPATLVNSYSLRKDHKDVTYFGEVERISVNDLKRQSNGQIKDEDIKKISATTSEWTRYHGFSTGNRDYREDDIQGTMVDVLHFNFKTSRVITYKKKLYDNGGFRIVEKGEGTPEVEGVDYEVKKKIIDVWYKGSLVLGTNHLYNYGLCENLVREDGLLGRTMPQYILYAPEMYQNRYRSLVERIRPYVDQMQQIHIKLQQMIAKARPKGVYIDVDGLEEIDYGDGNFLTPLELQKIYDDTGNVYGSGSAAGGDYSMSTRMPIQELENGVSAIVDLIQAYNHLLNLVRDAIGIPQGQDASMPHPDTLVGVQQQVALSSNTATRHILDSALNITERACLNSIMLLKGVLKSPHLKKAYTNAIGKISTELLKPLNDYHLYDIGLHIELKPDAQERQKLEFNVNKAVDKGQITLDDAIDIGNISNIKLAKELLKIRRQKREREAREFELQKIKENGEVQVNSAKQASDMRIQEIEAEKAKELAIVKAEMEAARDKIEAEKVAKLELMEKEFNYNITLKTTTDASQLMRDKIKEKEKTKRQDRNNTQKSIMNSSELPQNFESSEDNISGEIETSEIGPK